MNVLTDPMFSERASPVPFAGPRRLVPPGVAPDALPPIDVVLLSHNHYDHCDRPSIRALARAHPAASWVVPLGLARLVRRWGVVRVTELDWWDEARVDTPAGPATVGCTPARHFSARGLGDRGDTLWCGFTIRTAAAAAYFAGDTAMHPEFAAIGARFGPFDVIAMPVGAYEPRWFMRTVHVNAEEGVDAVAEVMRGSGGDVPAMIPIHWGTFRLTDEDPLEPPRRARAHWIMRGFPERAFWELRRGETRDVT